MDGLQGAVASLQAIKHRQLLVLPLHRLHLHRDASYPALNAGGIAARSAPLTISCRFSSCASILLSCCSLYLPASASVHMTIIAAGAPRGGLTF